MKRGSLGGKGIHRSFSSSNVLQQRHRHNCKKRKRKLNSDEYIQDVNTFCSSSAAPLMARLRKHEEVWAPSSARAARTHKHMGHRQRYKPQTVKVEEEKLSSVTDHTVHVTQQQRSELEHRDRAMHREKEVEAEMANSAHECCWSQ